MFGGNAIGYKNKEEKKKKDIFQVSPYIFYMCYCLSASYDSN